MTAARGRPRQPLAAGRPGRHAQSMHARARSTFVRPRRGRWIAGVCAALARRFGISVGLVRTITVVAVIFFGLSLWVYLILWLLIPAED